MSNNNRMHIYESISYILLTKVDLSLESTCIGLSNNAVKSTSLCLHTDCVDLSVQQFAVPGGRLHAGKLNRVTLVVKVTIGGNYTLEPNPATQTHNYDVQLYLSTDQNINSLDREVCF